MRGILRIPDTQIRDLPKVYGQLYQIRNLMENISFLCLRNDLGYCGIGKYAKPAFLLYDVEIHLWNFFFFFFDRAEELETALMEMVKQDNRRVLSARVHLMHI